MADILPNSIPDIDGVRERWGAFEFTPANDEQAKMLIGRYPPGRQQSAIIPLLDLAQRQIGASPDPGLAADPGDRVRRGAIWACPISALMRSRPSTRCSTSPRSGHHVQVCGTTPCMLRGSDDVLAACYAKGLKKGHTTPDGLFTLTEVECLGACANAPMVQINDDNYEDLTFESDGRHPRCARRGEGRRPARRSSARPAAPAAGRPRSPK